MILMALDQHDGDTQRMKQIVGNSTWIPKFVKSALKATEEQPLKLTGLTPQEKEKHPKLFQPGKVYHIRTDPFVPVEKGPRVVATEIADRYAFTEIRITSKMVYDHLPDEYEDALLAVLELTKKKDLVDD